MKNFFTKLIVLLIAFSLITPGVSSVTAQDMGGTEEEESQEEAGPGAEQPVEDYSITVNTTVEGIRIEGIEVKLEGDGESKSLTTSVAGDDQFTGLSSGTYNLNVVLTDESDVQLPEGESGTKSVTLSDSNQSESVTFVLVPKEPEPDENIENIQSIELPEELTKIGSKTTKISEIPEGELDNVENFTFDNPGVNRIIYREPLDLSTYSEYSRISLIENYINLEQVGEVRFDADLIDKFNQPAEIIMSQINLVPIDGEITPVIYRDGEIFEPETISYDDSSRELRFTVPGFSTYSLVPQFSLDLADLSPGESEDEFVSDIETFELTVNADNLDANITVFNNNELVDFPNEPSNDGSATGELTLAEGRNRFRVIAELENGESNEQFFTILFEEAEEPNEVSNIFGIVFFIIIITLGAGLGYYYLKMKNKESNINKNEEKTTKEMKPKYDERLMTDEEKKMYRSENGRDQKEDQKETDKDFDKNS